MSGNVRRASEIAAELAKREDWRRYGTVGSAIGAAICSAIPIAGGPLGVVVDKVGSHIFSAKLEPKFAELCRLVASLEPDLERIEQIDRRLTAAMTLIQSNSALLSRLSAIVADLAPRQPPQFWVETIGSEQSFNNVVVQNMMFLAEAHSGGVNRFNNVAVHSPTAHFRSTGGGRQEVNSSSFGGPHGSVGMNGAAIRGPVSTFSNKGEVGIGFGNGGEIELGGGWVMRADGDSFSIGVRTPKK